MVALPLAIQHTKLFLVRQRLRFFHARQQGRCSAQVSDLAETGDRRSPRIMRPTVVKRAGSETRAQRGFEQAVALVDPFGPIGPFFCQHVACSC